MGIPDHLTCFPRNLYAGQEATVRTKHGTMDWFQIGNGVQRSTSRLHIVTLVISWKMLGWMKHQLESRVLGEISIISDMQIRAPLWQKMKRNWSERGEWKSWLKIQHSKTKIMASSPVTSWQTDGETMETVRDFIFLGFKITAEGDCSHEIKRHLLLGRKNMTNLDSILKSRDITLPTKLWFFQDSCIDVRVGP